jgi:chromosome segregation ATPase
MSDPFSIASGAVGIISLGIQLCKQITEYAEAFRDYDADIESIGLKAESLKGPLKQLRDFVEDTQVTESETASDIAEKASQLERHLKRLENRLAKAKPVISDSLKEKLRNKWKNVAYPVRARDALRDIKDDLDSVQSTIQLALTM